MSSPSRGIVFVATGDRFVREAANAADSIKAVGIDYPVCLITDQTPAIGEWEDVILLDAPSYSSADKLHMLDAPYEQVLFLDTDTRVLAQLDPVFELLSRFELAVHQTPFGTWYNLEGVPKSFPEFNSGVLCFRKTSAVQDMFTRWREYYFQLRMPFDQPSLRKAVYFSDVRYAWLPAEFNFMPYMPTRASRPITIAHGRAKVDQMIAEMGGSRGNRTWVPRLGAIPDYNRASLHQLWRLNVRVTSLFAIEIVKRGFGLRVSPGVMIKLKRVLRPWKR